MNDPTKHPMQTFDPRGEIMAQLAVASDDTRRKDLLLFLSMFDGLAGTLREFSKKFDDFLSNEKAIRSTVLNGHADTHHEDHDFIKEQRAFKSTRKQIDTWALAKIEQDKEQSIVCDWAKMKMQEEVEAKKTAKSRWNKFSDVLIEKAAWIVIGGGATWLGLGGLVK